MALLLDGMSGGTILETPTPALNTEADGDTAEALKARIYADLLPKQREFVDDQEHRILGYIGGFGSGKSFALAAKSLYLGLANLGTTILVVEPTFAMIRQVIQPAFEDCFTRWGVDYDFRVSPQPEFTLHLPGGNVKLLCLSATNWPRVRGQNAAACLWDEADTTSVDVAQKAGEMFLARMRVGSVNQLAIASTPEGFRYCYRVFRERPDPSKRLIQVDTRDNPNLPEDFVRSLETNYSKALCEAYLSGNFVNMASAAVYPEFDRHLNSTEICEPTEDDIVWCGLDFNVDRCLLVCIVQRGTELHVFREGIARDTPRCIEWLQENFTPWIESGQLLLCPDASSSKRSSQNAGQSDLGLLRRAGMRTVNQPSNPFIRDRVNTVNMLIQNASGNRRLLVHPSCKEVIRGLEQQAYSLQTQQPEKGDGGADDLSGQMDALGYACWYLAGIRHGQVMSEVASWGRGDDRVDPIRELHPEMPREHRLPAAYLRSVPDREAEHAHRPRPQAGFR